MRYLKSTVNLGIMYHREINPELIAYSDSDYAGDVDTRRSNSGYVSLKNGVPIAWKNKKQENVPQSTIEAEYVASFYATQDFIGIRNLLKELREKDQMPTIILKTTKLQSRSVIIQLIILVLRLLAQNITSPER